MSSLEKPAVIWNAYETWRKDANTQYLSYVDWCQSVGVPTEKVLNFVDYWSQRNAS